MKSIIVASVCVFGVLEGHEAHHHDHETVEWTEEKAAFASIQVDVAGPGVIQKFSRVSGKILSHPDHLAYVTPRFEGTVFQISKNLGDRVQKGEVLAVIECPVVVEAKSAYLAAKSRLAVREEKLRWETALKGISAGQDYIEAKCAYDEAAIDCECKRQTLFAMNFTDEEIENLSHENPKERRFYSLKSPLEGRVIARNLTVGERAEDHTQAFLVANFEKVCVEMHIPPEEVGYLHEGQEVEIISTNDKHATAKISQFNPSICEETRMAVALAVMENPAQRWSPGQYVNGAILTKTLELPLVVPRESVQKMKGDYYVFVQCGDHFGPCKVKLGKMDEQNVEIVAGLNEGEHYVSRNAFCLKAELEKEELEHEH